MLIKGGIYELSFFVEGEENKVVKDVEMKDPDQDNDDEDIGDDFQFE